MALVGLVDEIFDYPPSFYSEGFNMSEKRFFIAGHRGKLVFQKKIIDQFLENGFNYSKNVYQYRCSLEKHLKTKHPKNRHLNLICKLIRYELRGEGEWALARRLE